MTAAAQPRPAIVVRAMDRATEMPYVSSTAVDAIVETHGGRFARREIFRSLMGDLIERSRAEVAVFDDDPFTIMGFAFWSDDGLLEFLYLRGSLSKTKCPPGCPGCERQTFHNHIGKRVFLELAIDFAAALLGKPSFVRMRRKPPQEWTWNAVKARGYVPSIMPEGL